MKIFPNLKYLTFYGLGEWEEWIGGSREGGKEDEDCITIMPRLQKLRIRFCRKLKSLPDFLRTTPLKELEINGCPIIEERCQRETGEDWHNICHIPIIKLLDDDLCDMTSDADSDSEVSLESETSSDSDTHWELAEDEEYASDFEPEENGSEEEEIDEDDDDDDGGEDDERPSKR
nr:putative disease resistance protein rga4 [Quercus suber]